MAKKAVKDSSGTKLVQDMPDDALVEIQGEGLFINGTGEPVPVEVPPEDADASESDVAP